jgi:O-antigen ligase
MEKVITNRRVYYYISYLIVVALFNVISVFFLDWQMIAGLDLFMLAVLFLSYFPVVGLYMMAILYPFSGWYMIYGGFNAPYHDVLGVTLFAGMILRSIILYIEGKKHYKQIILQYFPGLLLFGLFFGASLLSTIRSEEIFVELKYLLRPILFFYLIYIVLPINIIKTKKQILNVVKLMVASGLFSALLGFLSVVSNEGGWFARRAVPYHFFGYNLLGGNHNAMAETMIATIPLIFLLFVLSDKFRIKGWYILGILFSTVILLLTFSRTGWLALLVELLVLYFAFRKRHFKKAAVSFVILLIIVSLVSFYFIVWNEVGEVQGSTSSRLMMTQISITQFLQSPIIGNGLNSFNFLVGSTFSYWVEFGDALDAHGLIQKQITESGILGLLTYLSLLGYFVYRYYKFYREADSLKQRRIAMICLMMIFGVIFFQFFSTSYYGSRMWFPIAIGYSVLMLQHKKVL